MNTALTDALGERLGERDWRILSSLEAFRLLDTRQIQRLHFADHSSILAAARACARAMQRLQELGVVGALKRRIGGVRRGSASFIWQLAATGERLLRAMRGQAHRRRFVEPGVTFVKHTLAVNEVAVGLLEAGQEVVGFTVDDLITEPSNWRQYLGAHGETRWLKPDLYVVTSHEDDGGGYEEHAFLEVDLGTEHLPRIQDKCRMYAAYANTGAYQAKHGIFPEVVWLSADPGRRTALEAAVQTTRGLPPEAVRVTSPEAYVSAIGGAK